MATKNELFREQLSAWLTAKNDKKKRGEIIKHLCFVTGIHKKSVARKFKTLQLSCAENAPQKRGRKEYYDAEVTCALKTLWEASNELCGELLFPMIREYIDILERDGMWNHSDLATGKLRAMSKATVRRRVAHFEKIRPGRHGMSSTSPSALKHIIPIFKGPWKDLPAGNGQIDTVAHCGGSLAGDMAYTLDYVDSATYWGQMRAQWNKGQVATRACLEEIKERLPFPLLMVHPDTGCEFINYHLKGWCDVQRIAMTRSEPGKKNDNMMVEERNGHVIRDELGYIRFDVPEVVDALNVFYEKLCVYRNHFIPVRRTLEKNRIGATMQRVHEKVAKTPYQRVLEHPAITEEIQEKLRKEHTTLNPLLLKQELDTLKDIVYKIQKFGKNGDGKEGLIQEDLGNI